MANPWLKKNPFMSMWLSEANRVAAAMRGQASAQIKRQINTAVTDATNDHLRQLFETSVPELPKAKSKRRR